MRRKNPSAQHDYAIASEAISSLPILPVWSVGVGTSKPPAGYSLYESVRASAAIRAAGMLAACKRDAVKIAKALEGVGFVHVVISTSKDVFGLQRVEVEGWPPREDSKVEVSSVTMYAGSVDEWADTTILVKGKWAYNADPRSIYEAAAASSQWKSAIAGLPSSVNTRNDYGRVERVAVPVPRGWSSIEDWEVSANEARFSLANRD